MDDTPPTHIGFPYLGRCPDCKRSALFRAKPNAGEPDYNCYCRACGAKISVTEEAAEPHGLGQRKRITMRAVGGRKLEAAELDYYADGPVAIKREIGLGDFIMASVVLKAAKLANHANRTVFVSVSPRGVQTRDWLLGFPWVDELAPTWPEDVPPDRRIDLQAKYQFDHGWFGGVYERIDVTLGRAGVPKELWAQAGTPDYCPAPGSFERGVAFLRDHGIADEDRVIFIAAHSLGAPGRRSMPSAYFGQLLGRLLTETSAWIVGDLRGAEELVPAGTDLSRLVPARFNCSELVDVQYHADLLLTTDTGPLHLAACFGTPTIAWFSSSPPWARIAHYPNAVGVYNANGCTRGFWPCAMRGRPNCAEPTCMSTVPLEMVMELVHERLAAPRVVKVIGPPAYRDPEGLVVRALGAAGANGATVRHIPSTPNVGWVMEGPGSVVIDEGRKRVEVRR